MPSHVSGAHSTRTTLTEDVFYPASSTPVWARSWGADRSQQQHQVSPGVQRPPSSQASSPTKQASPAARPGTMATRLGAPSSPPIPPNQLHSWLGGHQPRIGRPDWNTRLAQASEGPGSPPLSGRNPVPSDPATYPVPQPAMSGEKEASVQVPVSPTVVGGATEGGAETWGATAPTTGIPAYRPAPNTVNIIGAASSRRATDPTPGAVVKLPRRSAWLRMLAYEGSWQLCLEAMMGGQAETAVQFLQDRCVTLRRALELDGLLLGGPGSEPGCAGFGECPIYWDDKEDVGVPTALERMVEASPPVSMPALPPPPTYVVEEIPSNHEEEEEEEEQPDNLENDEEVDAEDSFFTEPLLQTTCVRVVGCEYLGAAAPLAGSSAAVAAGSARPRYHVCMYKRGSGGNGRRSGSSERRGAAWTMVGSDGSTHDYTPVEVGLAAAAHGTLVVELRADRDKLLATGTVQMAELHQLAGSGDMFNAAADDGNRRLLRRVFPFLRKGGSGQASMAWVKLVDESGRTAGHAVLCPRVVTPLGRDALEGPMGPPRGEIGGRRRAIDEARTNNSNSRARHQSALPPSAGVRDVTGGPHGRAVSDACVVVNTNDNNRHHHDAGRLRGKGDLSVGADQMEAATAPQYTPAGYPSIASGGPPAMTPIDEEGVAFPGTAQGTSSVGYMQATALQVYDELLCAALGAQGAGPNALSIDNPWSWLLSEFARAHGVRKEYASLSYLKWVVSDEVATLTPDCFSLLGRELAPLLAARRAAALSSGELGVLARVCARADALLARCFECYFMLSERSAGGLADGALGVREGIPAALRPAVDLLLLLRDPNSDEADADWLAARFRLAARKRYMALLTASELQQQQQQDSMAAGGTMMRGAPTHTNPSSAAERASSPEVGAAYARVEELCRAVASELRADDDIRDAGILPSAVNLPELTSLEYVRGIISHVRRVLTKYPPPAPTEAGVRLVEAVGRLQDFVLRHGYREAGARLNSRDIFGSFVQQWISASGAALHATCRALESSTAGAEAVLVQGYISNNSNNAVNRGAQPQQATNGAPQGMTTRRRVSPLVEEMTSATEREMARYERIITYWPTYGPDLERVVTGALREATAAVSRQCGLVQSKDGHGSPVPRGTASPSPSPYAGGRHHRPSAMTGQPSPQHHNNNSNGMMMTVNNPTSTNQRAASAGQRSAWRWVVTRGAPSFAFRGAPAALARGITPAQALLLNSLRHLLAFAPQLEHRLGRWCGGGAGALAASAGGRFPPVAMGSARIARDAADLGAQSAQLVKELRSEYFAAITLCAERLAVELTAAPPTSVLLLLRRRGLAAHPSQLQGDLHAVLGELERLLQWLASALDTRVYVAVTRGLWDLSSKDVLEYAEDLQEGGGGGGQRGAWRGRQNASMAIQGLDSFFKSMLTSSMGNDLMDKDLIPPQHSDRAHKLLAENLSGINHSYDVY